MTKRPLAVVSVWFLLGILCVLHGNVPLYVLLTIGLFGFAVYLGREKQAVLIIVCVTCFLTGIVRAGAVVSRKERVSAAVTDKETLTLYGTITKKEIKNETTVYYVKTDECRVLVYPSDTVADLKIGSRVKLRGDVRLFRAPRNDGNFDEQTYYGSQGLDFKLYNGTWIGVSEPQFDVREMMFQLLTRMRTVIEDALPGEEGGILTAICLGTKAGLDTEVKNLFQETGLAHILAVSGLHVSVVGMGVYQFLRKRRLGFLLCGIITGILMLLYGTMCGNSVSTVRAVSMFLIFVLAQILGEAYDPPTALSAVGMGLLFYNPLYLSYAGFLLSFGTVLGIFVVANPLTKLYGDYRRLVWERTHRKDVGVSYHPTILERFMQQLLFSIGIQLFSLPILLSSFYTVSPYVILLNLIVLPFVGVLLGAGLIGGLLGVLIPMLPVLSRLVLYPCHLILYYYEFLMDHVLKLPFAKLYVGCPAAWKIFLYYMVLLVAVYLLCSNGEKYLLSYERSEEKYGRAEFRLPKRERMLARRLIVVLCVLPFFLCLHSRAGFSVNMLDVGQGDGLHIADGAGRHYMIDGGSTSMENVGAYRILPYLKYHGISRIDGWFVTHFDLDHLSGLCELLSDGYDVRTVYLAASALRDDASQNENYERLVALAKESGAEIRYLKRGDRVGDEKCYFTVLYPEREPAFSGTNENSLTLLLRYGGGNNSLTGVFTGDIGEEQERYILAAGGVADANITFLKAAHHGSNYSNSEEWLAALHPQFSLISAGENNRYGHPGTDAVQRMENVGTDIFCTITCGQITVTERRGRVIVSKFLEK